MRAMAELRRAQWLCAIFLAPVLACAVTASSYLALRCSMTGSLVAVSCCPDPAVPGQVPTHASLSDAPCCEPTVISTGKVPTLAPARAFTRLAGEALGSVLAGTPLAALGQPSPPGLARRAEQRPPWAGFPPPYLLTHALLI